MRSITYITPLLSLMLVACQTVDRPNPVESKQALAESLAAQEVAPATPPPAMMPEDVQRELSSDNLLAGYTPAKPIERRFDVSANDVDAKVFFPSLAQGTPLSVAVHPDVTGKISLSLKGVTLKEALQVVEDIYGYEVSQEGRILRIFPAGMRTETFSLNYLYMERQGLSLTSVNSGRISDDNNSNSNSNSSNSNNNFSNSSSNSDSSSSNGNSNEQTNGTFIRSKTKTDFWGELQETLVSIIGSTGGGRQVVVTPQAGLVTIRAYPNEIRQVRNFIKTAENHLQRQVILEAKVLEVTLSDGYQQGIHWDSVLGHVGSTDIEFGTSPTTGLSDQITSVLGGVTSIKLSGSDFSTMINLLDTQGDVDVLSSPRVTASNNQKAVIKVGTDEYFVTDVSSTTVAGNTPVTTPEVELTPFFSGIALDVTPQIDEQGNVLLHIHPSVIDIKEQTKTIKISENTLELPLAQSEIRESDTVIKAASGDVVVIGGLMKSENIELVSKVPLLGDIPYVGEAFTNRANSTVKTELVILLKPVVVGANTWQSELKRSQQLLDRWYPEEQ
ncbi:MULTISPECIES: pilus (MSHA type) biogenesis protein MshL [Shewanella]|uniref:Pilus (MSHA type) biogenesis protein MshL n=1 Tax=Shewanella fidelis TaxID=173509 RepID=A0AAW8NHL1_9GAMM|nr:MULTISPECIES: pilus (MSHA type) biogenesis protein MshL [Shewanella]MDR8522151.1 pilus (MSHA type) biogenesis protein MshL [Shewanella fidelis]MDW4812634.1 pilus (MSHA type) biogenesis protein MshL [Shewanella fidelis]MDW4816382.1 pilus (MSHA type) biogenesis protein MshL [Shewanella fidelis]MDW4820875.1 pilus (MSHA type) biogenesis protein MshL [Shewanella fidelis]MDW4825098.1 pilus (MSHA type) biogenesis protein MshL [Shewanella fidelis]